jgi:hypothetical protein
MKLFQLLAILLAGLAIFLAVLVPPLLPEGAGAIAGLLGLVLACLFGAVALAPLRPRPARAPRPRRPAERRPWT